VREEHSIDGPRSEKVAAIPENGCRRAIHEAFYEGGPTVKREDYCTFASQKKTHLYIEVRSVLNPRHRPQLRCKLPIEPFFSIENNPFNPLEVFGH
jgi:hypothetical protein